MPVTSLGMESNIRMWTPAPITSPVNQTLLQPWIEEVEVMGLRQGWEAEKPSGSWMVCEPPEHVPSDLTYKTNST